MCRYIGQRDILGNNNSDKSETTQLFERKHFGTLKNYFENLVQIIITKISFNIKILMFFSKLN